MMKDTNSDATAKAIVFTGDGRYEVRSFPMPTSPSSGAVLRVEAVGLCGSDAMQFHGDKHVPGEASPVVPGHEIVGVIHEITPEAQRNWGLNVGDRVCVDEVVPCGICLSCLSSSGVGACVNLHLYGYTKGPDDDGGLWGGYGEYMRLLPNTHLMKAPDNLAPHELTVFEPLANAINWVEKVGVGLGDRVLVQGPGHQGLLCAVAALAAGASRVIVSGTSSDELRLESALALGAHAVVDIETEDLSERINEFTDGRGVSVVMDVTPATASVQSAVDVVQLGGRIALAGLKHFRPIPELMTDLITLKMLTVVGCGGATRHTMDSAVQLLADHPEIARSMSGIHIGMDDLELGMSILERTADQDAVHVSLVHG
ncbi:zinc-dependent alcohol dehydrogenase [Rhodococcus sp. IEGM1428]|uniref:zinc-dependent alcohol dehydrogenase n=1 Tax=Rhodococcus sp. IEGM1428 TaxID=3392191 RepID=UPI003D1101B2